MKTKKNSSALLSEGFTLVELLIVVFIVGFFLTVLGFGLALVVALCSQ